MSNIPAGHVRGEVQIHDLNIVRPNPWNPNEMTPAMLESIKHGFTTDGWLVSQALLIWGIDDGGEERNMIIDGEHRWRGATELGMLQGPMVVLDGLSEPQAKALTVKLNQKRGDWNQEGLATLLQSIQYEVAGGITGIDMGFTDDEMMKLLATDSVDLAGLDPMAGDEATGDPGELRSPTLPSPSSEPPQQSGVRMVQLFLDDLTQPMFMEHIKQLAEKWGTKNVTDTTLEAVRRMVLEAEEVA